MTNFVAPHNSEAEEALLGSILVNPDLFRSMSEIVNAGDFYIQRNQWVWQSFESLTGQGVSIDVLTVSDELNRKGKLDEIGGPARLTELLGNIPSTLNAESYAVQVKDYAAKRELLAQANVMADWSMNGRRAADIQSDMVNKIIAVNVPNAKADKHTQTMADAAFEMYDDTDRASRREVIGVQTGFLDLDRVLGGAMYAPDFMLIAGRPGQGKTSLLVSIARHAAINGKKVCIFTLEMANKQIAMRLVSMETGIAYQSMRSGKLTEAQWPQFTDAFERISAYPIYMNDLPAISIKTIRQILRKLETLHGKMDLVIVDYLQLASGDENSQTREQEVSSVSRGFKGIAKEFDVPVLAAAQLSRAIEARSSRRPILSDLRESGGLEQDSDIVIFIHKPDEKNLSNTELIIAKNRNGEVGSIDLYFNAKQTKFENAMANSFNPNER